MHIKTINADSYAGIRSASVQPATPVTLFAGTNGAGKSSLAEGVIHALGGVASRVSLKKDFRSLVNAGQKSGSVSVETDEGDFCITLPSGKGVHSEHPALPFVLRPERFAEQTQDERRAFLFSLAGLSVGPQVVAAELKARGFSPEKVDDLGGRGFLASFEDGAKEAQGRAREAKASWKTLTGEAWGKDKAATWKAEPPADKFSDEDVQDAQETVQGLRAQIEAANQSIGLARAAAQRRIDLEGRIESLRVTASRLDGARKKLEHDQVQLDECTPSAAALPPSP